MPEYPRDLDGWLTATGHADNAELRSDCDYVLSMGRSRGWVHATAPDVVALGAALHSDPPRVASGLTPVHALALASELFSAEVLPGDDPPAHTEAQLRRAHRVVTALAREDEDATFDGMRQQAAFAAVRQLGGARIVDIPRWMELALEDTANWVACDDIIGRVELACAQTAPGRRWRYVYQLGFITYRSA